jgi:inosose dehydratase
MSSNLTRRDLLAAGFGLLAGSAFAAGEPKAGITVGITSNTRPDWSDDFVLSMRECSEVGYHWIETFWNYVTPWEDRPQELIELMAGMNLKMETVSNGGRMNTFFQKPDQRKQVIEDHMRLVRFIKKLGCDHLKINCGAENPGGNTPEIYREMAKTFDELGKRISGEGIKFGIHHHLWTQYEKRQDVDAIMELTDPKHVHMILDTGHTTMAGMDALKLTKDYGPRIIEFHLKDVAPKDRGGYKGPPLDRRNVNTTPDNRTFFELGKGGVDFPGILAHLNSIGWKGWFTVELDRTGTHAKESAAISKKYIEGVLKLKV